MLNREKEEQEEFRKYVKDKKEVDKYMEELNKNPIFREYMTYEEDQRKIFKSEMDYARKTGLEEGKKEGIKEGIEQSKLEIAKNLMKENISFDIISKTTGLTKEEIKLIK